VYFFAVVVPAVVYSRIFGRKAILNYRGGDAREFFRAWGCIVKPVFKYASAVTTPSVFLAEVIRQRFNVPVDVVPNVLDQSVFKRRVRERVRPNILVTRHLERIYGVDVAVEAFRHVQRHYPDARLWIAGTGSEEQRLRDVIRQWGVRNVEFLGYIAHERLGAIYDECDILLNASFIDNFPGSLLEAAGAGLVVVSTGVGGIPFMFENERTALLVQPGDAEALARAVGRILDSPALAAFLAGNATSVANACTWPEVRKSIYRAYGFALTELPEEGEALTAPPRLV
jgi:glycosyltransferase involved in cell wall biosynthesis